MEPQVITEIRFHEVISEYFQPHNIPLRCLFCQDLVVETELETHIRVDHRIGHDKAVENLIGLQYSEVGSLPELQMESPPVQEQTPVNEQPAVRCEMSLLRKID